MDKISFQRLVLALSGVLIALCTVVMGVHSLAPPGPTIPTTAPPGSSPSAAPPGSSIPPTAPSGNFFDDAAFVGDSVTLALRNYHLKTGILGNATFLCAGSFGVRHAVREDGIRLTFQGQPMSPQQALRDCGAKRVFLMLGMNDLAFGLEETMAHWEQLLANIRQSCPDVEIYIQSVTPVHRNFEGKKLNNENLESYNAKLRSFAAKKGCFYIDVASQMKDGTGALAEQFCSDQKCHLTEAAVQLWLEKLQEVAWENGY